MADDQIAAVKVGQYFQTLDRGDGLFRRVGVARRHGRIEIGRTSVIELVMGAMGDALQTKFNSVAGEYSNRPAANT